MVTKDKVSIRVSAYSGYKRNERPSSFTFGGDFYDIAAVLYRWYEPDYAFFKVLTTDGKTYVLRYEETNDEWTLTRRFNGAHFLNSSSII